MKWILIAVVASLATSLCAEVPSVPVNIISKESGKCIEMSGGPSADAPGVGVQQWQCVGSAQTNQIFTLRPVGRAEHEIVPLSSGLALQIAGGVPAAQGWKLEQWEYSGANFQRWILVPNGTDYVIRSASEPGMCMDVSNDAHSDGAAIVTASCSGSSSQTWKLSAIAAAESWRVTTLAGSAGRSGTTDGTGSAARFASPKGMSVDLDGNAYTVDNFCGTLRKITPTGTVSTLAGPAGSCAFGSTDGTGSAARFNAPSGTTVDRMGNVYVADSANCTLRKVTPFGRVSTVAGVPGACTSVDGPKSVARFNYLAGVAVDMAGDVYVTSWNDCTVRRVSANGSVITVAGVSTACASTDGNHINARFNHPSGIALGPDGNFYIADETGCTIRRMTPRGLVSTLAGSPNHCGSADGTGSSAQFNVPSWTAVDSFGNIYVSDYLNFTIRKVSPAAVVTTLAGRPGISGSSDGIGSSALFNHPDGIAVDFGGTVYVADRNNNLVRTLTLVP